MRRGLVLALAMALLASPAAAHKPSDAYLRVVIEPGSMPHGSLDVALRDLELALGLDGNGDGAITWGELKARHAAIAAYVQSRLVLESAGGRCELRPLEHLVDHHTDGAYAVLRFVAECPASAGLLALRYGLLFDVDPMHRGLLTVSQASAVTTAVLSPDQPESALAGSAEGSAGFGAFFSLGVEHIAFGLDHLLFLLVLLLPAGYVRSPSGAWLPVTSWSQALIEIVKVLTAFTLAHGISLAVATIGWVDLPTRLVESAIAATIVVTALDNVRPCLPRRRWLVVFGFGLIHGLGFASALRPLDLPPPDLAIALLGFNLGIEAVQVAVALCILAAACSLRILGLHARGLLPAGSIGALVLACFWFMERAVAGAITLF